MSKQTNIGFDIYQAVTDRIVTQLEKGIVPWRKPWKMVGVQVKGAEDSRKIAFNRISKIAYSPLNQMLLSKAGEYATFNQWKDLGGHIKKGAKSEMVVFWKIQQYKVVDESSEPEEDKETTIMVKTVPVLKYYQVFHISDVEGVKPLEHKAEDEHKKVEEVETAESIIDSYADREGIRIIYGGNSAYYLPEKDIICLPDNYQFGDKTVERYSTKFHEMVHSTGHKSRLDRFSEQKDACFGSKDYSKEELVAEIGASGLCNLIGIETESSFINSVAYIQSWLKALKNDNRLIVSASSKAEKAVNYIINGKAEQGGML